MSNNPKPVTKEVTFWQCRICGDEYLLWIDAAACCPADGYLSVACPFCAADVGEQCFNKRNEEMRRVHSDRRIFYETMPKTEAQAEGPTLDYYPEPT